MSVIRAVLRAVWNWLWGIKPEPAETPVAPTAPISPDAPDSAVGPTPSSPPPTAPAAAAPTTTTAAPAQIVERPWTNTATPRVIDVSHWQGTSIDFSKVAAAGYWGVICKASESTSYEDPTFVSNVERARAAGLLVGAYHFLHRQDGAAQAAWFLKVVGRSLSAPSLLLAADFERTSPSPLLTDLQSFCEAVAKATGKMPVVYSGDLLKELVAQKGADTGFLLKTRLWLAQYSTTPSWPKNLWKSPWLWQCSEHGKVPGIQGQDVDIDSFNGSRDDLTREWTL